MTEVKACKSCQTIKPHSDYYLLQGKPRASCKACMTEQSKKWKARNPERRKAINRASYGKHAAKRRVAMREYRAANIEERIAYDKKYREANREAHIARCRDWRERNSEAMRRASKEWKCANPERTKELSRKSAAEWKRQNPAAARASGARRDAAKRKATPAWADETAMLVIYERARELTLNTGILHHVDHIVPMNSPLVCGLHCEANLQILVSTANISKGNRWWPDMPNLSAEEMEMLKIKSALQPLEIAA